ncbi:cytochrome P450 [Alkalicoccus chagannorensis]|uniref:cytochrome P450 n=1 Tax=Alkalicoccus chagannorensis TaxID=427072 RepID=UPI00041E8E37|nr:cytochrome P450 [Alkalicoccus chagannorensis]
MSSVTELTTSRIENLLQFRRDPLAFFLRMQEEGGLVRLRTGKAPSYVLSDPDLIQEVLVTQGSSFRKGRTSEVLERTIGHGVLSSEGRQHQEQRRQFQPVFYKERIRSYSRIVLEEAKKMTEEIRGQKTVQLDANMMQLTLTIICRCMFHADVEDRKQEIAEAVDTTIRETAGNLMSPVLLPSFVPTASNLRHQAAVRTLNRTVEPLIEKNRGKGTMMDLLEEAAGTELPRQELRDQMVTMLLAGHETSANLLTWTWYLLSQNPEARARFQEEVSSVELTEPYEQLQELPFTEQVVKEALRLYPPAWLIYREAAEDVQIGGETFAAGSTWMICPYSIHRNPRVFEAPHQFRPERFAPGAAKPPAFGYFPFGGGARSCIGSRFALMETVIILAELGRHVWFRPTHGIRPDPLVSLRMQEGMKALVQERA